MYTRRGLLRAIGVGAVASASGCTAGEDGRSGVTASTSRRTTRTTRATSREPTGTTERETATESPSETETATERETETETKTESETETPEPASPEWSEERALPVARSAAGGAVFDGKLYYFGGFESGPNLAAVDGALAYDPGADENGSWEPIEDVPERLWAPCGVASESKIYSFGGAPPDGPYNGDPPTDAIYAYTPGGGWEDLTAERGVRCPYPNWAMSGVYDSEENLIYCVGGGTTVTDRESATDHGVEGDSRGRYDESRVWAFDPATERVVDPDFARLPEAKRWASLALVDVGGKKRLHAICGGRGVVGPTDSNYRIDLETGRVEERTPAPRPAFYVTKRDPVIGNRVYLTHGRFAESEGAGNGYTTTCLRYDPDADAFDELTLEPSHVRGRAVDGVIDGRLYVVGGHVKRYSRDDFHDCVRYNEAFVPRAD